MNTPDDIAQYVDASCAMLKLELDSPARERVIDTFMRTAQLAGPLLAFELPPELEVAHSFKP